MLFLLLSAFFAIFLFQQLYWKRRNYPPGPTPLPFIGNFLEVLKYEAGYQAFTNWRKQFGPIYTYWLGPFPFIVISEYERMKETFVKDGDAYTGKFGLEEATDLFRGGKYGIIDTTGETWREHRRFAMHQLRDFGVGRDLMQSKILLEMSFLAKDIENHKEGEVKVQEMFDIAVGSVINQFLFGYRFDEERLPELRQLKALVKLQMEKASDPKAIALCFPWTKYLSIGNDFRELLIQVRGQFWAFFQRQIDEHMKEIDFDQDESKDYVEAYLKERRKRKAPVGEKEIFSNENLMNILVDLWFAGLETTSNTLTWAIAYLLNNPEVQEEIHEELARVIGSDREIIMSDKNDLVYMNAFINESQRCANLLPVNLAHVLEKDVVLNGYEIPKGTGVLAQISTVMLDDKVFPEPHKFNPKRFIEDNGQLKKVDELIPFSIGKRQCLGEGLARMELFLFTANLLNRFKVKPGRAGPPSLKKRMGVTMCVETFTCLFEPKTY
ncbi:unnamed protein product [Caenorhabditis auriculariae]|uniref:CYtochrome P450 family n=1 Tax=Caenorhabditis auriculariae TaxID=2777116 RepID=A0A8S1HX56_9PELO|nr:unnamed protein product [Caenorhabditis auriculariae]